MIGALHAGVAHVHAHKRHQKSTLAKVADAMAEVVAKPIQHVLERRPLMLEAGPAVVVVEALPMLPVVAETLPVTAVIEPVAVVELVTPPVVVAAAAVEPEPVAEAVIAAPAVEPVVKVTPEVQQAAEFSAAPETEDPAAVEEMNEALQSISDQLADIEAARNARAAKAAEESEEVEKPAKYPLWVRLLPFVAGAGAVAEVIHLLVK